MSNTSTMIRVRPNTRQELDRIASEKGGTRTEAAERATKALREKIGYDIPADSAPVSSVATCTP